MRRSRPTTRAQPLGYVSLFASLIVAALLWAMLQLPKEQIAARRENATASIESDVRREAAQSGMEWSALLLDNYLFWVVGIAFFGTIAYTVFLRRAGP